MSEYEILEGINLTFGAAWSQLQWWASVSFGIIALTHLAANKLNALMVIGVTILYTLFTIYVYINITANTVTASGYLQDLAALQSSGQNSIAGREFMEFSGRYRVLNGRLFLICMVCTYIGTLFYLVYSYWISLRAKNI